jgi:hypothetical protein
MCQGWRTVFPGSVDVPFEDCFLEGEIYMTPGDNGSERNFLSFVVRYCCRRSSQWPGGQTLLWRLKREESCSIDEEEYIL